MFKSMCILCAHLYMRTYMHVHVHSCMHAYMYLCSTGPQFGNSQWHREIGCPAVQVACFLVQFEDLMVLSIVVKKGASVKVLLPSVSIKRQEHHPGIQPFKR